jgi:hypothetical protein
MLAHFNCEAEPTPPESRASGAKGDYRPGSFFTTLGIVRGRVGLNTVWRLSAVSPSLRETSPEQHLTVSGACFHAMKALLLYPEFPDTFWSFKSV